MGKMKISDVGPFVDYKVFFLVLSFISYEWANIANSLSPSINREVLFKGDQRLLSRVVKLVIRPQYIVGNMWVYHLPSHGPMV